MMRYAFFLLVVCVCGEYIVSRGSDRTPVVQSTPFSTWCVVLCDVCRRTAFWDTTCSIFCL
jgi:hypothetical protein